jgi:sec-independent protein translocase protein TatA
LYNILARPEPSGVFQSREEDLMFRTFGWPELLIVLAVVVLIFGATKLPQLGRAIGKTIRGFRQSLSGEGEEEEEEDKPKKKGQG